MTPKEALEVWGTAKFELDAALTDNNVHLDQSIFDALDALEGATRRLVALSDWVVNTALGDTECLLLVRAAHHHHHDYVDTLYAADEANCAACQEAERREDDEWNRPYRWVYDWSPPCRCETP